MNLRKKVVGMAAVAAFAAVSFSGNAFADPGDTSATLSSNASGACAANVTAGEIDLGTWTWNGTTKTYDHVDATTPGSVTVAVSQDIQPSIVCNVTLSIGNLTSTGGTILGTDLDVSASSGATGTGSSYAVTTPFGGQNVVLDVAAQSDAVGTTQAPGTYAGTITVASATAAP